MDPKWSPNQAKNEHAGAESGYLGQDLDTGLGILARISVSGPGSAHVDQDPGIWATFWASGPGSGHLGKVLGIWARIWASGRAGWSAIVCFCSLSSLRSRCCY